jgi:hypothetical protein
MPLQYTDPLAHSSFKQSIFQACQAEARLVRQKTQPVGCQDFDCFNCPNNVKRKKCHITKLSIMSFESTAIQPTFDRGTEGDAPSNVRHLRHDPLNSGFIEVSKGLAMGNSVELQSGEPFYLNVFSKVKEVSKSLIVRNRKNSLSGQTDTDFDQVISEYLEQKLRQDPNFMTKWSSTTTLAE